MDYFSWRRTLKVWVSMLLLSVCDFNLLLLNEIAIQVENCLFVEIQYPLNEIPENQAVMLVEVYSPSEIWRITANKHGKWKIFEASGEYYEEVKEKYGEDWSEGDFCDYILEDERISWQQERLIVDQKVLERALNIQKVKFLPERSKFSDILPQGVSWNLITPSPERETYGIEESIPIRYGLTMSYMQKRLEELEEMGHRVYELPLPPPSQRDSYWWNHIPELSS